MRLSPRNRLLILTGVPCLVRLTLIIVSVLQTGQDLPRYLQRADTPSFVSVARMIVTGVRPSSPWDERVFLGWPGLLAIPASFGRPEIAAVGLGIACASVVPLGFYALTRDFAVSVGLALLTPTWLMHSSLGMSEPAYLLLIIASLLFLDRGAVMASGLAMAGALSVRPTALFAAAGCLLVLLRRRDGRGVLGWCGLATLGPALTALLNVHFYGRWNRQAQLYSGTPNVPPDVLAALTRSQPAREYLNLPFVSLVLTPLRTPVQWWKVVFVYAHVLLLLTTLPVLVRRARLGAVPLALATWGVLNAVFIVCGGPYWGFHSFDRYFVWALPAYAMAFSAPDPARREDPRRLALSLLLGAISTTMALWGMVK